MYTNEEGALRDALMHAQYAAQVAGVEPEKVDEIALELFLSDAIKRMSSVAWYFMIEDHYGDLEVYTQTYLNCLKEKNA